MLNDRDFFIIGVGGEREYSQTVDERVEGDHFMRKRAEGSSMDESAGGEVVITGERGDRNSELLASYFDGEIYGRVETIQKLEEFGNKIAGSSPHTEYVINISPPEGNVWES